MKYYSAILFLIYLASFACFVQADEEDKTDSVKTVDAKTAQKSQTFHQEDECSRAGGACIAASSCPSESLSKHGSCPAQSEQGAVCCHTLSSSETICQKLGGFCRDSCPETLIIARANDCDDGLKCCPLV